MLFFVLVAAVLITVGLGFSLGEFVLLFFALLIGALVVNKVFKGWDL